MSTSNHRSTFRKYLSRSNLFQQTAPKSTPTSLLKSLIAHLRTRLQSTPEPIQRQLSSVTPTSGVLSSPTSGGDTPTDPIGTSRLPSAKPSGIPSSTALSSGLSSTPLAAGRKKPEVPPKPVLTPGTRKEHPEWMSFSEKKRHFEKPINNNNNNHESESRSDSRLSATSVSSTKQFTSSTSSSTFHSTELPESFQEEFLQESNGSSSMEEFSSTVQESENSRKVFRSLKSERLHRQRSGSEQDAEDWSKLSPAERKALEAEKRKEWRQARLKSIEDDPMMSMMSTMRSFESLDVQAKQDQIDEDGE